MLRKTSAVILFSVVAAPSFAGFYAGGAFGPEGALFIQKSHVTRLGSFNVIDKQQYGGVGVFGSVFGGYGWTHNNFYLAGEVNANLSSVQYELYNDELFNLTFSKTTFNVKYSEGVSILPGLFLSPSTLLYGRVGYINGRVKIRNADPTIRNINKNADGIRYGLGVRHDVSEHWTLMMDYSQINYARLKSFTYEPFGGVAKNTKITPNTAQVAFGVIYNFDSPQVYVK